MNAWRLPRIRGTTFLCAALVTAVLASTQPATTLAKTRPEIQLGDPDVGDQGPTNGPPKASKAINPSFESRNYMSIDTIRVWLRLIAAVHGLGR